MTKLLGCLDRPDEAADLIRAGFDGVVGAGPTNDPAQPPPAILGTLAADTLVLREADDDNVLALWQDRLPVPADLDDLVAKGRAGLVLRSSARLLDSATLAVLGGVVDECRARGLRIGFAGGLELPDIPRALALDPDLILIGRALRSADGRLDPALLGIIRGLVTTTTDALFGDRTARPPPVATTAVGLGRPAPLDRIFLRDLVLPIFIGAYATERDGPQRVRFAVEAALKPLGRPTRDMRDVVSYDLIADAIHVLTTDRHVDFVETLAEEIADRVLVHPRIVEVRVIVEKLDLGPGAVGVEIVRGKEGGPATA